MIESYSSFRRYAGVRGFPRWALLLLVAVLAGLFLTRAGAKEDDKDKAAAAAE